MVHKTVDCVTFLWLCFSIEPLLWLRIVEIIFFLKRKRHKINDNLILCVFLSLETKIHVSKKKRHIEFDIMLSCCVRMSIIFMLFHVFISNASRSYWMALCKYKYKTSEGAHTILKLLKIEVNYILCVCICIWWFFLPLSSVHPAKWKKHRRKMARIASAKKYWKMA